MTLIYQSNTVQQGTHAFLVGVGDYPHAKPNQGFNPLLRSVKDLASAADSAKLMADWLLDNRAALVPELASIEILISDVAGGASRYAPHNAEVQQPIERADGANIAAAGQRWLDRLLADPGGVAVFYACGHGANHGMSPVLFHSDLNLRTGGDAWSHLNIGRMAQAFRQQPHIAASFFFLDACGEFVPRFPPEARDSGFISPDIPSPTDRDKVWLLAAASAGSLAHSGMGTDAPANDPQYEGEEGQGSQVRFGRFTQTLLKGLNGASSRWTVDGWKVDSLSLWADLKPLHRTYFPHWVDKPFEPSQVLTPNERFPIIKHTAPSFPVIVSTDPAHRTGDFDLKISLSSAGAGPWIASRNQRAPHPWPVHIQGDRNVPFYVLAIDNAVCHSSFFQADQPQFDQRVVIR